MSRLGACVSTTVTDVWQLLLLPSGSCALHATSEVPSVKPSLPQPVVHPPQLSAHVDETVWGVVAPAHSSVTGASQLMDGASRSTTRMMELQVAVYPSTAV